MGANGFSSNPATPSAQGWNLVTTGDFNHDGIEDLMWQNALTGVTSEWLMSAGGGLGSNPSTPAAAGTPGAASMSDASHSVTFTGAAQAAHLITDIPLV
jgi:hypothetical protein